MTVKVKDGVKALEKALAEMKKLDPNQELMGNFDQGGYTADAMDLDKILFRVEDWSEDDEGEPACITACFY